MSNIDIKFYEGLAQEFVGKLRRVNNFTKHAPSIGAYHEEILRSTLRNLLPERYSLRTGFVFHSTEVVSNQIDILIVDEAEPTSYFFKEGNFAVVHPDCVVCGIEVKTFLDKEEFKNAVENINTLKKMAAYSSYKQSFGGLIFAYEGNELKPETTDTWWREIKNIPEDLALYPNMVFVLNRGRIDLRPKNDKTKENWGHYFVMGEDENLKVKNLSGFIQAVRKFSELKANKRSNPFLYAYIDGQCWSKEYLRFGKGLLTPK
jgi:hypothetical protein